MGSSAAPDERTLLNESAIIGLIRDLLAFEPDNDDPQLAPSLKLLESSTNDAREQAGCLLWDMAAVQEHAQVLAVSSTCLADRIFSIRTNINMLASPKSAKFWLLSTMSPVT